MTEQEWHNTKYIDKGNTCAQDTYFYCSELYGPSDYSKKFFANTYTDYADCVIKKTPLDCNQEFSPEKWSGGENPYEAALEEDYKIVEDYVNKMEDYDPTVGYDSDVILAKATIENNASEALKKDKMMVFGAALVIGILVIIKVK